MTSIDGLVILGDLFARAGASYEDRAAWIEDRRGGLTATEIRELVKSGPGYRRDLLLAKLGLRDYEAFFRARATEWGNEREPVIAEWVEARFGIRPESRVFRAVDEPRFLASPDGVGVAPLGGVLTGDELRIAEIKTGTEDLAPGTLEFEAKGYLLQMQWAMRVTGARRCLYVWEQHDGDWQDRGGDFHEPAPLHAEPRWMWIPYDPALVAVLEQVGREFLEELDALRDRLERGEDVLEYDDAIDTDAVNVLTFREAESSAKTAKEKAWKSLLARCAEKGRAFSQESPLARVTWTPAGGSTEVQVPDVDAARAADPALAAELDDVQARWAAHLAQHTRTEVTPAGKASLTVTAVKPKKGSKK